MTSIIKNKGSPLDMIDKSSTKLDPEGQDQDFEEKSESDQGLRNFEEKRAQKSRFVIYIYLFFQALAYSASLRAIWPYMAKYGEDIKKEQLGWVFSLNQIGYFIAAPLIGWWSGRINSIRIPIIFLFCIAFCANCWYALLPLQSMPSFFPSLLIEQFLIGVSNTNHVLVITYLIQTTTLKERTRTIAYFVLVQSIGYILGPFLQLALIPLGEDGYAIGFEGKLTLSMYTSTGWISAIIYIGAIILFLPKFFYEAQRLDATTSGSTTEAENDANDNLLGKENGKLMKIRSKKPKKESVFAKYFTVFVIFFTYFTTSMHVTAIDTISTPLVMDLYGLDEKTALAYVNIGNSVNALVAMVAYIGILVGPLADRFKDRNVLLVMGLIPLVLGRLFMFPIIGNSEIPIRRFGCIANATYLQELELEDQRFNDSAIQGPFYERSRCDDLELDWAIVDHGCPTDQKWCFETAKINPYSLMAGLFISTIGYAFTYSFLQSIYSKIFANKSAALKMGTYNSVGSLEYILGPILFSTLYARHGVLALNGVIMSFEAISLLLIILVYPKLIVHDK